MKLKNVSLVLLVSMGLVGCLQTRQQLRGEEPNNSGPKAQNEMQQEQIKESVQQNTVNERELQELRNRIDLLENSIAQSNSNANASVEDRQRMNQELDKRFRAYEEALKNIEIQVLGMVKDISDIKKKDSEIAAKPAGPNNSFQEGESLFDKKAWQDAILAYEAYRSKHPNGKNYSEATYKIGVAFQELSMKDEAKAFYNEVISKAPKSGAAKKAKTRLNSLK